MHAKARMRVYARFSLPLFKNLQKLLIRYMTITTTLNIIHALPTISLLFHLADPDFRAPHLLNTRGGVPGFYDDDEDEDEDEDGAIAALLQEDVVIVALQVALRAVGLL
jgi:hypothetical protein